MTLDGLGAKAPISYEDFQDVFIDATTLASARDNGWFAKSYIDICESGDENNRSYPNAKRTLQTLLNSVKKVLEKSGFADQRHTELLASLAEKKPLQYKSYYDSDIIKNAAPYLLDRTDSSKGSMHAPFIIGALRIKKITLANSSAKILNAETIEDPVIRSAIKVANAFDTLIRASIVREEGRTQKAIEGLELATEKSFETLDKWAFPEKYAPEKAPVDTHDLHQDLLAPDLESEGAPTDNTGIASSSSFSEEPTPNVPIKA